MEEALEATREAVEIRRKLASRHPDRFLPDLARSLGTYGRVLLLQGHPAEAADALAQGLRALLPHARRLPRAHAPLLGALLALYQQACQAAGLEPDPHLVNEARAVLGQG